jgi:RNA polymerase sigma factor (sigma-70 family)
MQAVDRFDINTNHRFLTYAEWWIRKEIMDELNSSNLIHVPTHKQKTLRRIYKYGKYVCVHCGIRTDSIYNTQHLPSCSCGGEHELEVPLVKDATALNNVLPIDDMQLSASGDIEGTVINNGMETLLRKIVSRIGMNERDKFIIMGYFDVATGDRKSDPKKLPQLAAITGITPERVRQIKERLLCRLKKELSKQSITKDSEFR